jgi:hypothetical protein
MTTIGLDLGHPTVSDAEHWLRLNADLLGDSDVVACTHLVRGERPRVAISVEGGSPAAAATLTALPAVSAAVASAAAVDHRARRSGRAVVYPGVDHLTGTVSVGDLLASTAIDRVLVLGGPPAGPEALVQTRDFVRPEWRDGLLTLVVTPAAGGRLAPFEVPNPTPCCADH